VVTHQLQVERWTGKVRQPETDVLPLCYATNLVGPSGEVFYAQSCDLKFQEEVREGTRIF